MSVHDIDGAQQAQESNSPGMIDTPYILFLGNVHDDLAAKTAFGIVDWRRSTQCALPMAPAASPNRS